MSAAPESWSELVQSYMRLRDLNQRRLGIEWGISSAVMSNWIGKGARPSLLNVIKVHEKSGLPLDRLLAAAGYISLEIASQQQYPPWLQSELEDLSTAELAVVAQTARGLHRLREESGAYEAGPPAPTPRASRSPRAPKGSPPKPL